MDTADRAAIHAKFWRKFLRLTRGRVNVLRALDVIALEETDPAMREALTAIRSELDRGIPLSEGIARYPADFSPCILELVRTAEKCGAWDEILQEIADGLSDGTFT